MRETMKLFYFTILIAFLVSCEEGASYKEHQKLFDDSYSVGDTNEDYSFEQFNNHYAARGTKPLPELNTYLENITSAPKPTCSEISEITEAKPTGPHSGIKSKTFDWITRNLKGGKYEFRKPAPSIPDDHRSICRSMNSAINGDTKGLIPVSSHCGNASFIGALIIMKKNNPVQFEEQKKDFLCDPNKGRLGYTYGKGYRQFNNQPYEWMKKYLGKKNTKKVSEANMDKYSKKSVPQKGDIVNIYRKNGSGHSVIFSHYKYSKSGKISKICYWSSNKNRGMSTRCEARSKMNTLTIGKL